LTLQVSPRKPQKRQRRDNTFKPNENQQTAHGFSTKQPKRGIAVIEDSMNKDVQPHKLSKTLSAWVNKISISGMTSSDFKYYLQPSLTKIPSAMIIHFGIKDLLQSV